MANIATASDTSSMQDVGRLQLQIHELEFNRARHLPCANTLATGPASPGALGMGRMKQPDLDPQRIERNPSWALSRIWVIVSHTFLGSR